MIFDGSLPVLLTFLLVSALAGNRAENRWCRQNLVEVLELLAGALLVTVGDGPVVNFFDVGEAVHDERAEQNRIRNFISLDRKTHQAGQRLQL